MLESGAQDLDELVERRMAECRDVGLSESKALFLARLCAENRMKLYALDSVRECLKLAAAICDD